MIAVRRALPGAMSLACTLLTVHLAAPVSAHGHASAGQAPRAARSKRSNRALTEHSAARRRPARPQRREHETGGDIHDAWRAWFADRASPNKTVDWAAYHRAIAHRDSMPGAVLALHSGQNVDAPVGGWQQLGPLNMTAQYRWFCGTGPISGRVNAVACDPKHAGVYYIGSAGGGLWKTTDAGKKWAPLSDSWPGLQVSSIAVDPVHTDTVYIGTGDFIWHGSGFGYGLQKSTDGGKTWTVLGATEFGNTDVSKVVVDPDRPNVVLVTTGQFGFDGSGIATEGQIWRSVDGGATWSSPLAKHPAYWTDVVYSIKDSTGHRSFYAAGANFDAEPYGTLWKSTDHGKSWEMLSPPLNASSQNVQYGLDVACSVNSPSTVYLLSSEDQAVYKSVDGGATWANTTNNFPTSAGDGFRNWSQWDYNYTITCSTRTDKQGKAWDVVYVGELDTEQSIDGGATWRTTGGPVYDPYRALVHTDQHAAMVNPTNPNEVLVGNDGGVYDFVYDSTADTWTWTSLNAGLDITQFYAADYHPTNPKYLIGGAQDNKSPFAAGSLKQWLAVTSGDGGACLINARNPKIQFCTYEYLGVARTSDAWSTFSYISPNTGYEWVAFEAPMVMDRKNPNLVFAATDHLWKWDDTTQAWLGDLGNQALASSQNWVEALAIAPTDDRRIYTGASDGQVWMTRDQGGTWTEIDQGKASLPPYAVKAIAVAPSNRDLVYVGLSGMGIGTGHLWMCTNARAGHLRTWTDISGTGATALPDVSLNAIAVDLDDPDHTLYAGTDLGVFMTTDGGATWLNATAPLGLPNVGVNALNAVAGTGMLNAATYGRGIWSIRIAQTLQTLTLNPSSVTGGSPSTATVTLTGPAPANGAVVSLASSNPTVGAVPATVTIAAGTTSATFSVTTTAVTADTAVKVTARYRGKSLTAVLKVTHQ